MHYPLKQIVLLMTISVAARHCPFVCGPPRLGPDSTKQKKVVLDNFFNNEWKKGADGQSVSFHYTWSDTANSGFSEWGKMFIEQGGDTLSLRARPQKSNLAGAKVFIIVDPDTQKETAQPNFVTAADADVIESWVKEGGTLILLANDSANCELTNFNTLASRFGITFNQDDFNRVPGDQFEYGAVDIRNSPAVFSGPIHAYVKEMSTLSVQPGVQVIIGKNNVPLGAINLVGKGRVFALGDPWLYNEYIAHRRLPPAFENEKAARQLVTWALLPNGN